MGIKTIAAAILAFMVFGAQANELVALSKPSAAAPSSDSAARRWQDLRLQVTADREVARVWQVNTLLNNIAYRSDLETQGVPDRWDTPMEFLARGAGDCEDFAIAKYMMLLESGVPAERLKLAFAFYNVDPSTPIGVGQAAAKRTHVVVLYHEADDGDPIVMDLVERMLPLSERHDLQLVFDFDLKGSYEIHHRQVSAGAVQRMMVNWIEVVRRGNLAPRSQDIVAHARAAVPRSTRAAAPVTTAMR